METLKVIKKGTKYKLCCCTHDSESKETSDVFELDEDMYEHELEKIAEEFMWSQKEPEWWFEIVE